MKRVVSVKEDEEYSLEAFLDEISDDFAYATAGLENLGKNGPTAENDARIIAEELSKNIKDAISAIASKIQGE